MCDENHDEILEKYLGEDPVLNEGLDDLLYYVSELVGWPDCVDSVSEEQAILCWKIVEKARKEKIAEEFKV